MDKSLYTPLLSNIGNTGSYSYMPLASVNKKYNFQAGILKTNNNWTALSKMSNYQERISYDANGYVQTGLRNGSSSQLALEDFQYNYDAVKKNKLMSIHNSINSQTYNYNYNDIGETIKDDLAGNTSLEWNVYACPRRRGKLTRVVKSDGTEITFTYDASGNRISKSVSGANGYTEWFVNDATGNIMAIYKIANGSSELHLTQQDIYGSSRLGVFYRDIDADAAPPNGINANLIGKYYVSSFTRGNKNYYFGNHLGNTLLITSDKKLQHSSDGTTVDYYNADVVSATDYSPFGVNLMDREFNSNNILYGFNGKWNDFEIGYQNYGMRMYSGRERRFKSVDMLTGKYPSLTPYQYAGNSPIGATDIDGNEPNWITWKLVYWFTKAKIGATNAGEIFKRNLHTVATQDNMGHFKGNDPESISQQVQEMRMNTAIAKSEVYGSVAKTSTYATIGFGTTFLIGATAPLLPELFTIAGTSQLTVEGYLIQKTLLAVADAGGQKLAVGKVDWFDVASDYLPSKGFLGKILLESLQATADYSNGELSTILDAISYSAASIDAASSLFVGKLFGKFNKQVEKAFIKSGASTDQINSVLGSIIKAQKTYIESALETAISAIAKEKQKNDKKNRRLGKF